MKGLITIPEQIQIVNQANKTNKNEEIKEEYFKKGKFFLRSCKYRCDHHDFPHPGKMKDNII